MSKGSRQRPARVKPETVERNWRRTFGEGVKRIVARRVAKEAGR